MNDSEFSKTRLWATIVAAFLVTEIAMLACAYLWVFIYATFINTMHDGAFYTADAQVASPIVAVVVAFPIFFAMGRYMRRFGSQALFAAMAVVVINLALDGFILFVAAGDQIPSYLTILVMSLLSAAMKFGGAYVGTRGAGVTAPAA